MHELTFDEIDFVPGGSEEARIIASSASAVSTAARGFAFIHSPVSGALTFTF